MTLEGIINIFNAQLQEDRRRKNIEEHKLLKLEESIEPSLKEDLSCIQIKIEILFNGYQLLTLQHRITDTRNLHIIESTIEKLRYQAVEYLIRILLYGRGEFDYKLLLEGTYKGYTSLL